MTDKTDAPAGPAGDTAGATPQAAPIEKLRSA